MNDKEYYGDYTWFKENILKWNTACDVIGIKQALWVLRFECKWEKGLDEMDEFKWNHLMKMLRKKYHELIKLGKINAEV